MPRTETFQSEKLVGAEFTLRVVGKMVRHRTNLALAEPRHKQRLMAQEYRKLLPITLAEEQIEEAYKQLSPEDQKTVDLINDRSRLVVEETRIAQGRELLESFSLPNDDQDTGIHTVDDLFEFGPETFVDEILEKAGEMWSLTPEERKNSRLPITSDGEKAGQTSDGTVIPASSDSTTQPEIAA